ncbi:D-alanyl-D-alanine carboxypeptidase/D-alanyl-D-alanine-endopeptidase [Goekera deserti]|nr:D-alanyl-D-alanine carboxypeptidase/D-alanyl-D-alanine-endopeptidase [Goekera deserti]
MGAVTTPAPTTRAARRQQAAAAAPRRTGATVAMVLVIVVALLLTAVLLVLRGGGPAGAGSAAAPVPDAVLPAVGDAPPVLADLDPDAPQPTALDSTLAPLLADPALGRGLSAQVVDARTGTVLFDRDGSDPGTPASTAKLLTAVAALTTLDPAATLPTTVVAGATPGEVVLVGGGDPTLSRTTPSATYPGAPTVDDLARQVTAALAGAPVTSVVVDNSLFSGPLTAAGWGADDAPSTYAAPVTAAAVDGARLAPGGLARSGQPGTDAGVALARALGAPSVPVTLGAAPPQARELGRVQSAPVARLVEQALSLSDNLLAETLARHVALTRGLPATFEGAGTAVTDAVREAGIDVTGVVLGDASGLSAGDLVPATTLTGLLRAAGDGSLPAAADLLSGLPVAGFDGTLADRGDPTGGAAPGSVRAKTGTLLGVNALAGTVLTADGRLLVFAVLADGAVGGLDPTEAALDRVAAALAGCGCR